jgi:hypothetical protein
VSGVVFRQYKQVQAFIPESFHKIKVVHETTEGRVEFNWKRCIIIVACVEIIQAVSPLQS